MTNRLLIAALGLSLAACGSVSDLKPQAGKSLPQKPALARKALTAEEGKLGVVVTFLGLLTLAKEQLVEIVQEAPFAPIYVKSLALMKEGEEIELSSEFDEPAANDG